MQQREVRHTVSDVDLASLTFDECRRCKSALRWLPTPRGKRIPLDVASRRSETGGRYSYLAHFAVCVARQRMIEERKRAPSHGEGTFSF